MTVKLCPKCRIEKPITDFWMDRQRGRRKSHCRVCTTAATRSWRHANPDYEKDRYSRSRVETRERHLVRKYGVTLAIYDEMLAAQNGLCAICRVPEKSQHNGVFHVDHCHATGKVRGLLCRGCNHMLGVVGDSPEVLQRAISYLSGPQIPELIGNAILSVHRSPAVTLPGVGTGLSADLALPGGVSGVVSVKDNMQVRFHASKDAVESEPCRYPIEIGRP